MFVNEDESVVKSDFRTFGALQASVPEPAANSERENSGFSLSEPVPLLGDSRCNG
jgi:hypothetical protein